MKNSIASKMQNESPRVVIAGAGITGLSSAYFLLKKHRTASILVDVTGEIAPGASGKAAGFLALDWNDGTPTEDLTHRSFALHQDLSDTFGAENIHYRRVKCLSAIINQPNQNTTKARKSKEQIGGKNTIDSNLEWASIELLRMTQEMGDESTVAQVHPKFLCRHLWKACEDGGCVLRKGQVVGTIANEATGSLQCVKLEGGDMISADALLYACGPWVANIMYGIKGHSLILPTKRKLTQCVFFYDKTFGDCEVFVRPDGTAFCSGFPDDPKKVKEFPGKEVVEPEKADRLLQAVRQCSGQIEEKQIDGQITRKRVFGEQIMRQACFQPVTDDFLPIMGSLSKRATSGCSDGCYIAGGNNCWGILLGPATGECMADLIAGKLQGKKEEEALATLKVDISKFRPSRYRGLKPVAD